MKLVEKFNQFRFDRAVKAIVRTPALKLGAGEPFTVLSMVHHRDVFPYLLALKSLVRFLRPERVILVADPTINEEDRAILREQVPMIIIRDASEFRHPGLPTYSSWRRLCAISEYVADGYVVQLDADTVTTRPVPEVASAIRNRTSFILGTEDDQDFLSCSVAAEWARWAIVKHGYDRVQALAEAVLDQLDLPGTVRYVRGCAGFSGFAPGSFDLARMLEISQRMGALLGEAWSRWGTEQFTTNLIISNTPHARVLPHPKYCMPTVRNHDTAFIHFIGYERYLSGLYGELATDIAKELLGVDG